MCSKVCELIGFGKTQLIRPVELSVVMLVKSKGGLVTAGGGALLATGAGLVRANVVHCEEVWLPQVAGKSRLTTLVMSVDKLKEEEREEKLP